jgi:hypothetical protein
MKIGAERFDVPVLELLNHARVGVVMRPDVTTHRNLYAARECIEPRCVVVCVEEAVLGAMVRNLKYRQTRDLGKLQDNLVPVARLAVSRKQKADLTKG